MLRPARRKPPPTALGRRKAVMDPPRMQSCSVQQGTKNDQGNQCRIVTGMLLGCQGRTTIRQEPPTTVYPYRQRHLRPGRSRPCATSGSNPPPPHRPPQEGPTRMQPGSRTPATPRPPAKTGPSPPPLAQAAPRTPPLPAATPPPTPTPRPQPPPP